MTFSARQVLTAAQLNDLDINTITTSGNGTIGGDLTVDTNTLHVDSTNNFVGIGTASPAAELDIKGASNPEIRLQSTDSTDPFLYFGDQVDTVRGGIGYDTSANALQLRGYNNSTRLAIDSSGNVGIGTTSPAVKLQVNGELLANSQWAGVSTPYAWSSAYKNGWLNVAKQGSYMNIGAQGIYILRDGYYHVIAGQRANSTNDTFIGIGENGNRSTLENRTDGNWSHDHAGYPNKWTWSVYIGYLANGELLTAGAPNSTYSSRLTFSNSGKWAGFMFAIWLGD